MNDFDRITARKQALIKRAAQQRAELSAACAQLQRPAAIFDKGYAVASQIKSHPGIAMSAVALVGLFLVKRGVAGKLAGVAVNAVRYAMPVARYLWSKK